MLINKKKDKPTSKQFDNQMKIVSSRYIVNDLPFSPDTKTRHGYL